MVTITAALSKFFDVYLLTAEPFPSEKLGRFWGPEALEIRSHSMLDRRFPSSVVLALYPLFYFWYVVKIWVIRPDVVIYSDDILGPAWPISRMGSRILVYAHLPLEIRLRTGFFVGERAGGFPVGTVVVWFGKVFLRAFLSSSARSADLVVCNSPYTKRYVDMFWRRKDSIIVPPPVDTKKYKPGVKTNSVVMLGAIQRSKQQELAIMALPLTGHRPKLTIMGLVYDIEPDYWKYLIELAGQLGVEDLVRIIPNASIEVVLDELAKAKIVVHASYMELFGIAIVEAMSAGCIPIVLPTEGSWEVVLGSGEYGLPFGDFKDLASKIDHVLENPDVESVLRGKAMLHAKEFDTSKFSDRVVSLVYQLVQASVTPKST